MGDLYMDCGYVVCNSLSDQLNKLLCLGILFLGFWQMNVLRLELIP